MIAVVLLMVVQTYLLLVIATSRREQGEQPFVAWPLPAVENMPRFRKQKEPLSDEPVAPWGL